MALLHISKPYNHLEAWGYDRCIAPTVCQVWMTDVVAAERVFETVESKSEFLDVGCGGGQIALAMAEQFPSCSVTGIDLNKAQVRRALTRAKQQKSRAKFVEGNAAELPFPDDCFDLVYSVASIKHWAEREKGIAECCRALRPNGILVLGDADPNCAREEIVRLVARYGFPKFLSPIVRRVFLTNVARGSPSQAEVESLLNVPMLEDVTVTSLRGYPAWIALARKRKDSSANDSVRPQ